jgi:hypothetical protein
MAKIEERAEPDQVEVTRTIGGDRHDTVRGR